MSARCPVCRRTSAGGDEICDDCRDAWVASKGWDVPYSDVTNAAVVWYARRAWEFADAAAEQVRPVARTYGDPGPSRFVQRRRGAKR